MIKLNEENRVSKISLYAANNAVVNKTLKEDEVLELLATSRNEYYEKFFCNSQKLSNPDTDKPVAEAMLSDLLDLTKQLLFTKNILKENNTNSLYVNYIDLLAFNILNEIQKYKHSNISTDKILSVKNILSSINPSMHIRYGELSGMTQLREIIMRFQEPLKLISKGRDIHNVDDKIHYYNDLLIKIYTTDFKTSYFNTDRSQNNDYSNTTSLQRYLIEKDTNQTTIRLSDKEKISLKNIIYKKIQQALQSIQIKSPRSL